MRPRASCDAIGKDAVIPEQQQESLYTQRPDIPQQLRRWHHASASAAATLRRPEPGCASMFNVYQRGLPI